MKMNFSTMTRAWDKEKILSPRRESNLVSLLKNLSSLFITELKIYHLYYLQMSR